MAVGRRESYCADTVRLVMIVERRRGRTTRFAVDLVILVFVMVREYVVVDVVVAVVAAAVEKIVGMLVSLGLLSGRTCRCQTNLQVM